MEDRVPGQARDSGGAPDSGQIEHVWGQLISLDAATMTVSLATEPSNPLKAKPPFTVSMISKIGNS
jgi:hypothetical protein